jgi:predicted ester cyclase
MSYIRLFSRNVAMIFCLPILCWQAFSQIQAADPKGNPCPEKGGTSMTIEANKALIRRVYELSTQKDVAKLFELYDPGYIEHLRDRDESLQQMKAGIPVLFAAFTDIKFTVEDMVAEGDKVAYRVTITGTHTGGPYMGIAPTGKKFEMRNTSIKRIVNGKLAESWGTLDSLSAMRQLGLIPAR